MAKIVDYSLDTEAQDIAVKLQEKYEELFGHIDFTKVKFVRELNKKTGKLSKLSSVKYPADIDNPYTYYITINDSKWKKLDDSRKVVAVMQRLFGIPVGGTDNQSGSYAKIRRPEVAEYPEMLSVVKSNYDWETNDMYPIENPLEITGNVEGITVPFATVEKDDANEIPEEDNGNPF